MKKILTSVYSGTGDVRKENQDSFLCKTGKIGRHTAGLFIVADGCGGLADGAQISKLITASFNNFWDTELAALLQNRRINKDEVNTILERRLENINREALAFGNQMGAKVGSTISLMLVIDTVYYIKNIGDSRIYRVRYGMKQLTEDQTLVADMVRNGEITPEEAKTHKKRHVLSMCMGYFERLRIYSVSGLIHRCDNYIICCDGLYNYLSSKDMRSTVFRRRTSRFESVAGDMRNMIKKGAARDNVTVIVLRFKGNYW